MRGGTGAKQRVIRALNANTKQSFSFDRSINPRGGTLAKLKIRTNKKGISKAKVFQDINSDGRVSGKELIFKGKSNRIHDKDELINFSGSARLKKTMHKCEWISLKFPGEPLMCTQEYIPTIYELTLIDDGLEILEFGGIGKFKDPLFKDFSMK